MSAEEQLPRLSPAPRVTVSVEQTPTFVRAPEDPRIVEAGWQRRQRLHLTPGGAGLHQARDKTCLHRVRNQEKSQAAHPNACSLPLALAGGVVLD